ncbi:MAG: citrate:proton symporter, partial [Acidobacteria bacterium]|nr:citrate:proton symporter [Acidobacteriota bacterium]
ATALGLDMREVFVPLLPAMVAGAAWVLFVSWVLGRRERRRLGVLPENALSDIHASTAQDGRPPAGDASCRRPRLFWLNFALTGGLLIALVSGVVPLPVLFLVAFAIALVVNYPSIDEQRARIAVNAPNALAVAVVIFAAGVFTGILSGTRMVDAIANSVLALVPVPLGPYLAGITALLSMPFTFLLSNDAFYFGVVPILSQAAAAYGISPQEMARASLVGQPVHLLSPLVPSTYLLVGLSGVELGDHQRFTLKWTVASALVMLMVGLGLGVIPLVGHRP